MIGYARAEPYRCGCTQPNIGLREGDPNGEVRTRTVGAEGVCNLIGRTTISTNQTLQSIQGLSHQSKSTQGVPMTPAGYVAEDCLINGWGALWSCGGLMTQDREMLGL